VLTTATTPKRLYLFQLGSGSMPVGDQRLEMSLGSYLVQMSDGKNILIDTGVPANWTPPREGVNLTMRPNVVEQLAALGIQPDDIDIVISTHFDIDHVGFHDAFPNAEHVVQREQYEKARDGHPRFAGNRDKWGHPALHYRLIDGDTELLPGLELIATSGHAPGHQSVLVRLPRTGAVLLAVDAVARGELFTTDRTPWPIDDDPEELLVSTQKLLDLVDRHKVALVVFGHDGTQWSTLKRAPEWYE
jgi:N-acyl homoserine lactone hydrolase